VATVTLVRHAEAASTWSDAADPGLSRRGLEQATAVAAVLGVGRPLVLVTSPMRRCLETAAALAERWGVEPQVDPRVSEIPSPRGIALRERSAWLKGVMAGRWSSLPRELRAWRQEVVAAVVEAGELGDAVVFTHHVAINAALGFAAGDDRVRVASPDNCSQTVVDVIGGRLVLVELGREADTEVR
jgi:broad specificity phosphatase PhoE